MKPPSNAARLVALVLASGASGYLWRAALEPGATQTIVRLAPRSNLDARGRPAPHVVRVSAPAQPHRGHAGVRRHPTELVSRSIAAGPRVSVAAPVSRPRPAPNPRPRPNPEPKPTPQPAPAPRPTPAPSESSPSVAASAPPSTQPSAPPPTASESGGSRPGNGHGDDNHDHTGPPGHQGDDTGASDSGHGHGHGD